MIPETCERCRHWLTVTQPERSCRRILSPKYTDPTKPADSCDYWEPIDGLLK